MDYKHVILTSKYQESWSNSLSIRKHWTQGDPNIYWAHLEWYQRKLCTLCPDRNPKTYVADVVLTSEVTSMSTYDLKIWDCRVEHLPISANYINTNTSGPRSKIYTQKSSERQKLIFMPNSPKSHARERNVREMNQNHRHLMSWNDQIISHVLTLDSYPYQMSLT